MTQVSTNQNICWPETPRKGVLANTEEKSSPRLSLGQDQSVPLGLSCEHTQKPGLLIASSCECTRPTCWGGGGWWDKEMLLGSQTVWEHPVWMQTGPSLDSESQLLHFAATSWRKSSLGPLDGNFSRSPPHTEAIKSALANSNRLPCTHILVFALSHTCNGTGQMR